MYTPTSMSPTPIANAPIPLSDPVNLPELPIKARRKPPVSMAAARKAAKEAGWYVVDASRVQAAGVFGRFVGQCGAIDIGRGRLMVEAGKRDQIDTMVDELLGEDLEVATRLELLRLKGDLMRGGTEIAKQLIASEPKTSPDGPAPLRLPAFGPQTAVVVNVNGKNGASASTEARQDVSTD